MLNPHAEISTGTGYLAEDHEITGEYLEDLTGQGAACYLNVRLSDRVFITLALLSDRGLCLVLPSQGRENTSIGMEARLLMGVDIRS